MTVGAYVITGGLADGTDSATLTIRATYGNTYIDRTVFVSKAKAGAQGDPGSPGTGSPAVALQLSRPTMMVLTYAEGTPVDSTFAGFDGYATLIAGSNDVTASATLSIAGANCAGSINTALDTPTVGKAKGYYKLTSISQDNATLTVTANYGGFNYTAQVNVTKAKGGYEIVGALPGTNLFEGRVVYLTTDGKLYRCHLGAWTAAVPAPDLSGLITMNQMLQSGQGAAINDDPILADPTAWQLWGSGTKPVFITSSNGVVGTNVAWVNPGPGSMVGVRGIPMHSGKTYRASAWVYAGGGTNGLFYLRFDLRDSNNAHNGYITSIAEAKTVPIGVWTKYSGLFFVPSTSPLGAIGVLLNYGGTAGNMQVQDIRLEEVISGDLILARTIQASNIQAGALTATEIAAGTITGDKIAAGNIITASAQINDGVIISAKIGDLQVNSAKIVDLTVGTQKITANAVSSMASASFGTTACGYQMWTNVTSGGVSLLHTGVAPLPSMVCHGLVNLQSPTDGNIQFNMRVVWTDANTLATLRTQQYLGLWTPGASNWYGAQTFNHAFHDVLPDPGTRTVNVRVDVYSNNTGVQVNTATLTLAENRR